MKWFLWYIGALLFVVPIITTLLSANDKSISKKENAHDKKPPYPKRGMQIAFYIGVIILIVAFILTVM